MKIYILNNERIPELYFFGDLFSYRNYLFVKFLLTVSRYCRTLNRAPILIFIFAHTLRTVWDLSQIVRQIV